MKSFIKSLLKYFSIIYLVASIGAASFIWLVERNATFGVEILWQLLFVCFISALISTLLIEPQKEYSKKEAVFRIIAHVILIYALIFGSGLIFNWVSINNSSECIGFSVMFFGIYAGVWAAIYNKDNKEAQELNKRIKYYNEEKEK